MGFKEKLKKSLLSLGVWPYAKRYNSTHKKLILWISSVLFRISLLATCPIFALKRKQMFFILGYPRSGSTLLLSYLNSHPNIRCINEPLDGSVYYGFSNQIKEPKLALSFLKLSLTCTSKSLSGAKIFLGQLYNLGITLDDIVGIHRKAKFIILYRRDLLEQYLSYEIAKQKGEFSWYPGYNEHKRTITINHHHLESYYESMTSDYRKLKTKLGQNSISICYEDICNKTAEQTLNDIQEYLGCDLRELKTSMIKQNNWKLEETIVNYDELEELINSPKRFLNLE